MFHGGGPAVEKSSSAKRESDGGLVATGGVFATSSSNSGDWALARAASLGAEVPNRDIFTEDNRITCRRQWHQAFLKQFFSTRGKSAGFEALKVV